VPHDNQPNAFSGDSGLPPEARVFLDQIVGGSLMRFDILRFFHQNPYAILTISDLSVWMSLEERPLAEALQQLSVLGYLSQSRASAAFVLSPDRERRRQMDLFFEFLDDRPDVARRIRQSLRRRLETKQDGS
jgi:hypothetical protein